MVWVFRVIIKSHSYWDNHQWLHQLNYDSVTQETELLKVWLHITFMETPSGQEVRHTVINKLLRGLNNGVYSHSSGKWPTRSGEKLDLNREILSKWQSNFSQSNVYLQIIGKKKRGDSSEFFTVTMRKMKNASWNSIHVSYYSYLELDLLQKLSN